VKDKRKASPFTAGIRAVSSVVVVFNRQLPGSSRTGVRPERL